MEQSSETKDGGSPHAGSDTVLARDRDSPDTPIRPAIKCEQAPGLSIDHMQPAILHITRTRIKSPERSSAHRSSKKTISLKKPIAAPEWSYSVQASPREALFSSEGARRGGLTFRPVDSLDTASLSNHRYGQQQV